MLLKLKRMPRLSCRGDVAFLFNHTVFSVFENLILKNFIAVESEFIRHLPKISEAKLLCDSCFQVEDRIILFLKVTIISQLLEIKIKT